VQQEVDTFGGHDVGKLRSCELRVEEDQISTGAGNGDQSQDVLPRVAGEYPDPRPRGHALIHESLSQLTGAPPQLAVRQGTVWVDDSAGPGIPRRRGSDCADDPPAPHPHGAEGQGYAVGLSKIDVRARQDGVCSQPRSDRHLGIPSISPRRGAAWRT
jgi:hypothetical protein